MIPTAVLVRFKFRTIITLKEILQGWLFKMFREHVSALLLNSAQAAQMWRRAASLRWVGLGFLLLPLVLAACGGNTPPPSGGTALNQLHWCDKPTQLFQDGSQTPPAALTEWSQVKAQLDFTVYLPATLPDGSCLVSAHALVKDKVLGSNFSVSYLLPGGVPLALSETSLSDQNASPFQCSADASNKGTFDCLGAKDKTNVVIVSKAAQKDLQSLFSGLQPNVDWQPKK
jgi:type II secretory pathway pseudopilin PulG